MQYSFSFIRVDEKPSADHNKERPEDPEYNVIPRQESSVSSTSGSTGSRFSERLSAPMAHRPTFAILNFTPMSPRVLYRRGPFPAIPLAVWRERVARRTGGRVVNGSRL